MRGWSKHKLKYLRSYITSYRIATKGTFETFYIDGFAGPGRLPDEDDNTLLVDGSPLIALEADPPFRACYLIELDSEVCDDLREATREFPNARVVQGDANDEIPRILDTIHPKSPTLVVLDPTGVVGQVRWSTIAAIARRQTEVFINFPYHMAVQRILPIDQNQMTDERAKELSLYLPPGWQEVYHRSVDPERSGLCRRFLELYRDQLRGLGYEYAYASSAFRTNGGIPLYYLIWAGKNKTGARIAKHVILKQFNPQTIRLLDVEDSDWIAS
jgi:three-Cys-motif partner protein